MDDAKSWRIKSKRRAPKAERAKPGVGTDGQELREVEARMSVRERTAAVTKLVEKYGMEEEGKRGTRGRVLLEQHVSFQELEKKDSDRVGGGVCWKT